MFRVKQCSNLAIPKISQVVMLFMGAFGLVSVQNFIRSGMNQSSMDERPPTLQTLKYYPSQVLFVSSKRDFFNMVYGLLRMVNFYEIFQYYTLNNEYNRIIILFN